MWPVASRLFTTRNLIIVALLIIVSYLLPYYILGEDTHIRVHDNLDSNIVWYKLLAESGMIFASPDTMMPQIINGLPRSALPSGLDGAVWLYVLFKPFTAYTISQTLMRFVAFYGMYLLLRKNVLQKTTHPVIAVGVALLYAILPFWPSGALSVAGLPLALHIFLTIRKQGRRIPWYYWLYLFVMAFFSSFILTFFFFLSIMGILWLVDWIRTKRFNTPFFLSIAGMTGIYMIKNYMLIYAMFIESDFVSHRDMMDLGHKNFSETMELFRENFIESHTHVIDLHQYIILPVILIALAVALFRKLDVRLLLGLLAANVLFSAIYALWYWEGMRVLKDSFMIFNTFNFGRFHFLKPLLWYMMFAIALTILWKSFRFSRIFLIILIVVQCGLLFSKTEELKYSDLEKPTFKEFYATELFDDIEDYIGKDVEDFRVVSVAMHPTIAQYNGFYTLDTYNNTFPYEYKEKFEKIVAPELDKSKKLKNYFHEWGGRLYMYVSEIGKHYVFTKSSDKTIESLDINTDQLKEMGGDYVLSGVPIENHDETGLTFEKTFEHPGTQWKIYLYQVE